MDRPNIVVIMADQLAPHFVGAYGNTVVKTPHIDALAARGTRFDAAYCNSPLCAPSRAAMMTGKMPSQTGVFDNAAELPASIPTFAHHLAAVGYRTCLAGRMHFVGPDQLHGFAERLNTDVYPADFTWTPDWEHHEQRIDSWYHNMSPVLEAGPALATFQTDYDDEVAFTTRRWLIERGRDRGTGDTTPFCLVSSYMHPHDPYVAKPEWWDAYQDAAIDMPEGGVALDPFSQRVRDGIEASTTPVTDRDIQNARRGYFANVSYFDSHVGMIVQTLEDIGELENTVIVVTSDHGDMLGDKGLWYKMSFFEKSARVPLIMAGPDVGHGSIGNACSLVDLLPTFCEVASCAVPNTDGRSLWPLATGDSDTVDEAFGEYCAEMTGWPVYMIRRGRFKYIHSQMDPPQLYDLHNDLQETHNLANDEQHSETASRFAGEVAERWDCASLRDAVIASQKARRVVNTARTHGSRQDWDYTPPRDGGSEYVRNNVDWTTAAARFRFPPID